MVRAAGPCAGHRSRAGRRSAGSRSARAECRRPTSPSARNTSQRILSRKPSGLPCPRAARPGSGCSSSPPATRGGSPGATCRAAARGVGRTSRSPSGRGSRGAAVPTRRSASPVATRRASTCGRRTVGCARRRCVEATGALRAWRSLACGGLSSRRRNGRTVLTLARSASRPRCRRCRPSERERRRRHHERARGPPPLRPVPSGLTQGAQARASRAPVRRGFRRSPGASVRRRRCPNRAANWVGFRCG